MFRNTTMIVSTIAVVAALSAPSVRAEQPEKYTKQHEPFTAYGMQVRMSIIDPINKSWKTSYQATVFQEVAPCRLVTTRTADRYEAPYGGPQFQPNETRHYLSRGVLLTETSVNPCSEVIPIDAIGIVGRFTVTPGNGDGEVHVDPLQAMSRAATTVLKFQKNKVLMFEAGVFLASDGTFDVATSDAGADVTIDVLGFLLPDPSPVGARGDKGEKGEKGDQGERGATGEVGPQGLPGLPGAPGAPGAPGVTGPKGDRGDIGGVGPQGPQGSKGDKGDRGDTGLQGVKGDRGDKGDRGEIGPQGPVGAQGPRGFDGPPGRDGHDGISNITKGTGCYPPGNNANNQVMVSNASVTPSSIVILNYTDAGSNGNAQAIVGQGMGYFTTTGSPNRCFQYVIINAKP